MQFILKVKHNFPSKVFWVGIWKVKFQKELTWKEAPFHKLDGKEIKVERMRMTTYFQYGVFSSLNARAVRIPFEQ